MPREKKLPKDDTMPGTVWLCPWARESERGSRPVWRAKEAQENWANACAADSNGDQPRECRNCPGPVKYRREE